MKLMPHQQKVIDEARPRLLIHYGVGAGKTIIGHSLAKRDSTGGKNTLVLAMLQQAVDGTWEKDCSAWGFAKPTIMSKEQFKKVSRTLPRFTTLLIDESHMFIGCDTKTYSRQKREHVKTSDLFRLLYEYIQRTAPEQIYLLSGTGVPQPISFYTIGLLLGVKHPAYEFRAVRDAFYIKKRIGFYKTKNGILRENNQYLLRSDKAAIEKYGKMVRAISFVGRLEDWFNVPDQHHERVVVGLSHAQLQKIDELDMEYPDTTAYRVKRLQVENGLLMTDDNVTFFPNNKLEWIIDMAANHDKLIVFAPHRHMVTHIAEELKKRYPTSHIVALTGATKKEERKHMMGAINAASKAVLIATSSISAGYELPSISHTIFTSAAAFKDVEQGRGRTLRANAIKENWYYYLVSGEYDAKRWKGLGLRMKFNESIYDKKRTAVAY